MKKLIIALCATMFALGVQASAVDWHFTISAVDINFEDIAGTISLYFNDNPLGTVDMEYGGATGDFELDTAGGTIKVVAEITNFSDGAGTLEYSYVFTSLPLAGYPDVDSSLDQINSSIELGINKDGTLDLSQTIADNGYSPAAPVIPEPTTGLLVLLGIAGLALKRKQA